MVELVVVFSVTLNSSAPNNKGPTDMSTASLIRVDQSGDADFKKIQDAIDSVPSDNSELVFIWIKPGTYRLTNSYYEYSSFFN